MKINIFATAFLLLSAASCAQEDSPVKYPIHDFDENLKKYLFTKYDGFQITEIFSKNDGKKIFLKNSLGEGFIKGTINIASREILFKELSTKTQSHICIAILTYSDEQSARSAIKTIEHSSYFENTKILTKYTSKNNGHRNVILYTESSADKLVLDYIDQYFGKQMTN